MKQIVERLATPVVKQYDVVVCGGGPAGIAAAVTAAENGASTLLIEAFPTLGGQFLTGQVTWLPVTNMCIMPAYNETKPLQSGFINRLMDRLIETGGAYPNDGLVENPVTPQEIFNQADPEIAKVVVMQMCLDAGVTLLTQSWVSAAIMEGDVIKGVIVENKSGRQAIEAKVVIDTTGDGDVIARAGGEFELAKDLMNMSLVGAWANVETEKIDYFTREGMRRFRQRIEEAIANGDLAQREEISQIAQAGKANQVAKILPMKPLRPGSYPANWWRRGEAMGNIASTKADPTDAWSMARAEIQVRKDLIQIANFYRKYVPGYEHSYLSYTAGIIGIREARRLVGEQVLSIKGKKPEELLHPDVITRCRTAEFSLSSYTPEKAPNFDIPYGCLVPVKVDQLLVAGRCISMDHYTATQISPRDVITCFCLGQAAGTAAALSIREGVCPRKLKVSKLQQVLTKQGANVEYTGA